jgi:hypothetical protein
VEVGRIDDGGDGGQRSTVNRPGQMNEMDINTGKILKLKNPDGKIIGLQKHLALSVKG